MLTLILGACAAPAWCEPPQRGWSALVISGGGVPSSNAVAHEKNVRFVEDTLQRRGIAAGRIRSLVASGTRTVPEVAYRKPIEGERWELYALDRLFGDGNADLEYRPARLGKGAGRANRDGVLTGLRASLKGLTEGASLLVYVTDHGGGGEPYGDDNYMVLWRNEKLTAGEYRQAVNDHHKRGRVVSVMAQCFSGAFSSSMYGPETRTLAAPDRCGFFATTSDRVSAGCTPELSEADYDDYTTRFFAALGGRRRTGEPAEAADYDGDGSVSYAEAHAYALGASETLDVPVRTSEVFLEEAGVPQVKQWKAALAAASAPDRAAWMRIAARLRLAEEGDPAAAIANGLAKVRADLDALRDRLDGFADRGAELEDGLRARLLERWPMLGSPFHPRFAATMEREGEAIRSFLQADAGFRAWDRLLREEGDAWARRHELEVDEAWWLRASRLHAHLLRAAAVKPDSEIGRGLTRLQACENSAPD